MNNFRTINISQKYKFFSWAPARTGSTHFTNILEKLGFGCADINLETKKLSNFKLKAEHNHTCIFFENHWDYKFITSMRNPYSMMISRTGIINLDDMEDSNKILKIRMENMTQNPLHFDGGCMCYHERKPDYVIRLEHLYEDWLKLPFVPNHGLNLSGELEKLTKIRLNNSANDGGDYWKKYYDQALADLVYYNYPDSFELFGYDKDSWKS
jgi:hypothetical protein